MGNFDVTTPLGTDFISLGDNNVRELKVAVQEALRGGTSEGTEAIFPGAAPTTAPVFRYRGLKGTTGARPAFGQYGLYMNTTLNTIQRDNGSGWEDVATLIPSGTKMVFYQAAPPTGWTAVAVNDKFLRVVTSGGTGGTNGGTVAASTTLAHTHTIASESSHTHDLSNHTHSTPNHKHITDYSTTSVESNAAPATVNTSSVVSSDSDGAMIKSAGAGAGGTFRVILNQTKTDGSGTSGTPSSNTSGAGSAHDHGGVSGSTFAGAFAYADVVVATKD